MSFKERFTRWLSFTREVMRPMSFKQKLGYILRYYKGAIFLLLVLCLFIGYAGEVIVNSRKDIYLQGFFTNDDYGLFDAETLEKEYSALLQLDKSQKIVFDDDLYIDLGGNATEYTAASNGKLIAYMATNDLDFCITSEEVLHHYEEQTPFLDFEEFLPAFMFDALKPYLYQYTNPQGETKYIALEMSQSFFVKNDPRDIDTHYYIFVPYLAPHPEHTADFILWCFEDAF